MRDAALHSPLLLCALVVLFGAMASLVPVSPVEPVLVGVATVAPPWLLVPLVALATVSHMATKTLVFIGGARIERAFSGRNRERFEKVRARLTGSERLQRSTLFFSSVTGLPPFYLTTALCGTLRMPLRHFLILATTGRAIRFAVLIFLPQLLRAQLPAPSFVAPPAITVSGEGRETFVLVSGMVGGVAGYRPIESRLVELGNRVITIDPYHLSLDSADVSFDAKVVGHAHGGGVALRLATRAPTRVRALFLLDVGARATNRSAVFSSSIRLVPFITRLPKGKSFVQSRFVAGLRANSGRTGWLDDYTTRAYTEPMLHNISRVVAMSLRLAEAEEPEPLSAVIERIRVPVTLILGELKRPASPGHDELAALVPLGELVRIDTIAGVGHFVHREAPVDVVAMITRSSSSVAHLRPRGGP